MRPSLRFRDRKTAFLGLRKAPGQVAKWLGHSSYVLTLTTYGDYIPDEEAANPLPEPVAAPPKANVVNLFG